MGRLSEGVTEKESERRGASECIIRVTKQCIFFTDAFID